MLYDPARDTLYVANTQNNSIANYPNATTSQTIEQPITVYHGYPLNVPLGLTINPLKADLITINQVDNNMVEIAPGLSMGVDGEVFNAHVVAIKTVDKTPVNVNNGTGSALFGVLITTDKNGNLLVYYTDPNTNTLNAFEYMGLASY